MTHPMRLASLGGATTTYVDDVFSTYLYTGSGTTAQTITNGIDLAGKGGLVWIKSRGAVGYSHALIDTARGVGKYLKTDTTDNQFTDANALTNFYNNGFRVANYTGTNGSGTLYTSWTFRKAPKFFDVVTYTGNGTTQTINHSLGQTPGMVIVKNASAGSDWYVWHRSLTSGYYIRLNSTGAQANASASIIFGNNTVTVDPTSTQFTVGSSGDVNGNGNTIVAYLFAHDTAADGLIQCGSTTGAVTLGWEPQFLLYKSSTNTEDWQVVDNMRGWVAGGATQKLSPNLSAAEAAGQTVQLTATGFDGSFTGTVVYLAIRRPNKPPTSGTEVYNAIAQTASAGGSGSVGFPVDLTVCTYRTAYNTNYMGVFQDRLRGYATANTSGTYPALVSNSTQSETVLSPGNPVIYGVNNAQSTIYYGTNAATGSTIVWNFRRAPGVFDEVCYTGTGSARTVDHGLGVVPEMIITKARTKTYAGRVYHLGMSNTEVLYFYYGPGDAKSTETTAWNSTTPTSTVFTVGTGLAVNESTTPYVAYLFATLPGISKVFSYTGNGSSQTINCGFAAGARFVLIKRTDSTGDWYVWDSARGIVAGNDPHLSLNSTAAEVTTDDSVDTDNSGFIVNQVAATNVNINAASYIGIAFA